MRVIVLFLIVVLSAQTCFAWSEGGHHLIAVMAFETLSHDQQQEVSTLLKSHPRFAEDFKPPEKISDPAEIQRWLVGRAGYWPDVARSQPVFTRPNWHYQLGASMVVGQPVNVPATPGPLPADATMETGNLHIAQAIQLCRSVLKDKSRPSSERALAICWLIHLVGDAHQPCHAGSLYYAKVFPEGDRGANSIPTKQFKNLHALWDGLLGPFFDAGDVQRRERSIIADRANWQEAQSAAKSSNGLDPLRWLSESAELGRSHVYTKEIMTPVEAVAKGKV
ncbi:MAG TPA: S1/P1 nuclease, partial [Schlesneria sp.]